MTKQSYPTSHASSSASFETCIVLLLGYPGMGKRTIGAQLAAMLDRVVGRQPADQPATHRTVPLGRR